MPKSGAVEPDSKEYAAFMGVPSKVQSGGGSGTSGAPAATPAPAYAPPANVPAARPAVAGKPSWAQ